MPHLYGAVRTGSELRRELLTNNKIVPQCTVRISLMTAVYSRWYHRRVGHRLDALI